MPYVPVHERVHPPAYPVYAASSDPMSDSERGEPSRKRRRESASPPSSSGVDGRHAEPTPPPGAGEQEAPPPAPAPAPASGISPSIFGIAPRNEVTRVVGDFIMRFGRGKANLEIEVKLGTVCNPGREWRGRTRERRIGR